MFNKRKLNQIVDFGNPKRCDLFGYMTAKTVHPGINYLFLLSVAQIFRIHATYIVPIKFDTGVLYCYLIGLRFTC